MSEENHKPIACLCKDLNLHFSVPAIENPAIRPEPTLPHPFFLFRSVFRGFVQSLISHPIAALVLPLPGDGVLVDGGRGHGQRCRGAARPHPPQSGREDLRQDAQRARAQGTPERECTTLLLKRTPRVKSVESVGRWGEVSSQEGREEPR